MVKPPGVVVLVVVAVVVVVAAVGVGATISPRSERR